MKTLRYRIGPSVLVLAVVSAVGPGLASAQGGITFVEHAGAVTVSYGNLDGCAHDEQVTSSGLTASFSTVLECWCSPGTVVGGVAYMVAPPGAPFPGAISCWILLETTSTCIGVECEWGCVGTMTANFASIGDAGPPVYPDPGTPVLVQDGTLQRLSDYLVGSGLPSVPNPIYVQSDLNLPVPAGRATWGRVKAAYR